MCLYSFKRDPFLSKSVIFIEVKHGQNVISQNGFTEYVLIEWRQ